MAKSACTICAATTARGAHFQLTLLSHADMLHTRYNRFIRINIDFFCFYKRICMQKSPHTHADARRNGTFARIYSSWGVLGSQIKIHVWCYIYSAKYIDAAGIEAICNFNIPKKFLPFCSYWTSLGDFFFFL